MNEHVYLVDAVLLSDQEQVQVKADVGLQFDTDPPPTLVAARLTCALLGSEPGCTDVGRLAFTRIA